MERLVEWDHKLFWLINGAQLPWLDPIMKGLSNIPIWIPLYVLLVGACFYKRPWKIGLTAVLGMGLTFLLTDQISASLIKELVQRLRPSHIEDWADSIHLLEGKGGLYSFVSSHASSTFGLATFTSLFFRKKAYTWGIYIWASLVSYSRIYVGKHFPFDIVGGAILGLLTGYLVYQLFKLIVRKAFAKDALPA